MGYGKILQRTQTTKLFPVPLLEERAMNMQYFPSYFCR